MPSPPRDVGFDQKLGATVPLDVMLRDEMGNPVALGSYFGVRPVILSLVYYGCPMLCGMSLNGLAGSLKTLKFEAGKEFEVLSVSFNPAEGPAEALAKKNALLTVYKRPGAHNWHFLTADAEAIRRLTASVGFRYVYDKETKQFAHATGVVVLTPEGRISRYLFGTDVSAKDLRLALIESTDRKIGTPVDQLTLLCYQYNPKMGKYGAVAVNLMRGGAVVTMLGFGVFFFAMNRQNRQNRRSRTSEIERGDG